MTGPAQPAVGEKSADDSQAQNAQNGEAAGNGGTGSGAKRDPLYENLPDDHPLVKRHEALKEENRQLKPKAKLVDDAEEAKKTDAQKIADLQSKLDAQPAAVAAALREHLVELHGIDKDDAELFLTGTTPELLLKQVTRLLEQSGGGGKRSNSVPREGTKLSRPKPDSKREFISAITKRDE